MRLRALLPLVLLAGTAAADDRPLVPLSALAAPADAPTPAAGRLQLIRVAPAFLVGVPSLDADDKQADADGGPDWLSVSVGNDNPLLDFRPRREPGGVGYNRLFSQVQLFDDSRTACSLVLQATTPAGSQYDGLPDRMGPTVVTPALSVYHALGDDGTALQLSLNKNVGLSNVTTQPYRRELQCGLALHSPLSSDDRDPLRALYVSVEALGQYKLERDPRTPLTWDVLPGLHWRPADNWRISGALTVPMDRTDVPRFWQVTCALQF